LVNKKSEEILKSPGARRLSLVEHGERHAQKIRVNVNKNDIEYQKQKKECTFKPITNKTKKAVRYKELVNDVRSSAYRGIN